jgi:hypothetical protein
VAPPPAETLAAAGLGEGDRDAARRTGGTAHGLKERRRCALTGRAAARDTEAAVTQGDEREKVLSIGIEASCGGG